MTPDEQQRAVAELEREVDRLHALYNQYFMGIEKTEPVIQRKNLDRKINALRREQILNTALRFKMQMQIQKYNTQSTYWNRICRQIENGTYKRQVMLAKRRIEARHVTPDTHSAHGLDSSLFTGEDLPMTHEIDVTEFDIELDEPFGGETPPQSSPVPKPGSGAIDTIDDPFAEAMPKQNNRPSSIPPRRPTPEAPPVVSATINSARHLDDTYPESSRKPTAPRPGTSTTTSHRPALRPPKPARPKPTARQENAASGLSPEKAKAIYKKYLIAKKRCNESTDKLTYQKVAKSLQNSYAKSGNAVDFKVVIRNGKAVIKTVKSD